MSPCTRYVCIRFFTSTVTAYVMDLIKAADPTGELQLQKMESQRNAGKCMRPHSTTSIELEQPGMAMSHRKSGESLRKIPPHNGNNTNTPLTLGPSTTTGLSFYQEKIYRREDLAVLNLFEQPVWIFDIEGKAMWWANTAAVELWSADSLASLLKRDFAHDMSEATACRLADYLVRFRKGERIKDQWTFYPNGGIHGPKTFLTTASGIRFEKGERPCSSKVFRKKCVTYRVRHLSEV